MEFLMIIVFAITAVIAGNIWNANKATEETQAASRRIAGNEQILHSSPGEIVGGNHPRIGSSYGKINLGITKSFLIIDRNGNAVKLPLETVRASLADKSALSVGKILLFGVFAFGAKEKLLFIEINDPLTGEQYNAVFRNIINQDHIASRINALHYDLLVTKNN